MSEIADGVRAASLAVATLMPIVNPLGMWGGLADLIRPMMSTV
jgi:hypothetical protein